MARKVKEASETTDRRRFLAGALLAASASPFRLNNPEVDSPRTVTLRGRILCLTEDLASLYQVIPDCESRGHLYTLRTLESESYPLLPTDTAAAVWLDERFRERELQIVGRLFPSLPFLEVIKFQTWRDGSLFDLHYFCDVCMINTHKPGPCDCCQDPVVLRESPPQ
jgi:hypothetical protein